MMTIQEKVNKLAESLPPNASIEDFMERLLLLRKIEKGIEQAETGQGIPHNQVKEKMKKWLN